MDHCHLTTADLAASDAQRARALAERLATKIDAIGNLLGVDLDTKADELIKAREAAAKAEKERFEAEDEKERLASGMSKYEWVIDKVTKNNLKNLCNLVRDGY